MQVPRSTLQDHVYRQLCSLILDGEIEPGQLITIQALADAFGVSTMPVREALHKLTGGKALTIVSGRSIGIPPLTPERLQDLTRVRSEIEGTVAEWSVDHVTKQAIADLQKLMAKMSAAAESRDAKAFLRSNREFHFTIYKLAASDTAYSIIEGLWLQIAPYFHHLRDLDRYSAANAQHERILHALKTGNRSAVKQGIRTDIQTGSNLLMRVLAKPAK